MFTFYFESPRGAARAHRFGPVHGVRIDRRSLQLYPSSEEVMRLTGDLWSRGESKFSALVIPSKALIYVERSRRHKGRFYGPFDYLRVARGALFTSRNARLAIARFNPLDDAWCVDLDRSYWPTIMFISCTYLDEPAIDELEGFVRY